MPALILAQTMRLSGSKPSFDWRGYRTVIAAACSKNGVNYVLNELIAGVGEVALLACREDRWKDPSPPPPFSHSASRDWWRLLSRQ